VKKKPFFTDVKTSFLKALFAIIGGLVLGASASGIFSGEGRTLQEELDILRSFFTF
jgi:hypothetical protein